jgi:GTP cyclohydrolase I
MNLKVSDINHFFEEKAPLYLAEEWDNVGILLGSMEREVHKVLVCLDVTKAVVREAINLKVDLIISHHPLIFKGIKRINEDSQKGSVIYSLIQNDISVYCAHTNLDVADEGVNEQLAKSIGLTNLKNLNDYKTEEKSGKVYGLGRYGELEKALSLSDFISLVKNKLSVDHLRFIGSIDRDIKTVAVFCGSFDEDYSGFLKSGADILLTSDLKYHTASDIMEMGLCVIDAGHFNTEKIIIAKLIQQLEQVFPQIEFKGSTVEVDPFKFT